jgi:hypothetical protein
MSLNDTIANIQFDWAFLQSIRNEERDGKETGQMKSYYNGIPFQHYILFKTICIMPDRKDGLTTRDVMNTMTNVFGLEVSQPAVSRAVESLKQLNLVEGINNPIGNATLAWIKLTNKGRKLQRLYLGSTSEWKDRLRVVSVRSLDDLIVTKTTDNKRTA